MQHPFIRRGIGRRALAALALTVPAARAQDGPARPIRLVVPFAPGGVADLVGRLLADRLPAQLGQAIIVDNRPGAGATVGAAFVAQATPDGTTLLFGTPGPQIINPHLMRTLPYDPVRGFSPVALLLRAPNLVVVHPSVPARTVAELIALAKARPGELTFGSSGIGSSSHLGGEMLKHMAGIDLTHVPFRGSGPAVQELLAGRVSLALDTLPLFTEHLRAGTLRALAVTTPGRSPLLPEVPTVAETLPGFDASALNYLAVPAGTPAPVVARLNAAVNAVLADPGFRARLAELAIEPLGGTPETAAATIAAESARWGAVIRAAGVRAE